MGWPALSLAKPHNNQTDRAPKRIGSKTQRHKQYLMEHGFATDQTNKAEHGQMSVQAFSFYKVSTAHLRRGVVLPVALISQKSCSCHGCLRVGPYRSMPPR